MTLERRLAEALHGVDRFQPSVDLFRRTSRSIEEDRAHRRRVQHVTVAVVLLVAVIALLFGVLVDRDTAGLLVVPKWALIAAQVLLAVVILVALGPVIRRLGAPFLGAAFHLSHETAGRFSRLLDLAYYLYFGGEIVAGVDVTELDSVVPFPGAAEGLVHQLGVFLGGLGVVHALNLLAIPVAGLVFTAVYRRALRREAGPEAPPVSARAQQADRIATWIVLGLAAVLVAVALVFVGIVVGLSTA